MKVMDTEKARELIGTSGSAVFFLGKNPTEADFLAREVLKTFFQKKGGLAYLFPETPEEIKNKWASIVGFHKNPSLANEIFVRFPKNRFNVKEINYEEDENFLTLKILSGENGAEKSNIIFNSRPMSVESIFCICQTDSDFSDLNEKISLPEEEKIVFINSGEQTLTEKVFDIIQPFYEENNNIPNLLLASLLLETDNFKRGATGECLNLAQQLLSFGADKKLIDEIIKKEISAPFTRILGRTLARTRLDEKTQSVWSFLSPRDFEKAGVENPGNLLVRRLAKEIKEFSPGCQSYIIIWGITENEIYALFIKEKTGNKKEMFLGPFKSFSEAEIKIRQNLKETM